jgi:hypothetical protein
MGLEEEICFSTDLNEGRYERIGRGLEHRLRSRLIIGVRMNRVERLDSLMKVEARDWSNLSDPNPGSTRRGCVPQTVDPLRRFVQG